MTAIAVLLTFASGASDATCFTRLGNVFSSVMTGNMVLFGVSLSRHSGSMAWHTATAVAGYALGVTIGTRIAWFHARTSGRERGGERWAPHLMMTLLVEFLLLSCVAVGWELTGGVPAGAGQLALLACAACSMGIQSAAVEDMGISGVSTTYLTGTLTAMVASIASPDKESRAGLRRPGVLLGLIAGAGLAGLLLATVTSLVPALPLLAVAGVMVLLSGRRRDPNP